MGKFTVHYNTKNSDKYQLTSVDLLVNSLLVDCIFLAALAKDHTQKTKRMSPLLDIYEIEKGAEIVSINYSNPLDIKAIINSLSQVPVDWVLQRTLFYAQESRKREIANEIERQELVKLKIENCKLLIELRDKALERGINPDQAAEVIGSAVADLHIELRSETTNAANF
jgi:hypothetical protein